MKHTLLPLLFCLGLLCGCAAQNPPAAVPTVPAVTEESEVVKSVLSMEAPSEEAALTQYPLTQTVSGFLPMNRGLLFFSGTEETTLTLLDPQTRQPLAVYEAGLVLTADNFTVQRLSGGLSYFDGANRETVMLDDGLRILRRIPAPEGLTGAPLLSSDGAHLYYCTQDAIRVLDLTSGISRILKESAYPVQGLSGLLLGDTVLQLSITDSDGSWKTLFLSCETGQLLREFDGLCSPATGETCYFLSGAEGILVGQADTAPMVLQPRLNDCDAFFLPDSFGALTAALSEGSTVLDRYDLASGRRTAELILPDILTIHSLWESPDGTLWFLTVGDDPGTQTLYRWDCTASSVNDNTYYLHSYHTPQNPDYDGLAACAVSARETGERYGIEILIYQDAVAVEPWDYRLEPEYQAGTLQQELAALEHRLSALPPEVLSTLAETYTALKICLVGSAESTAHGPEAVNGIQFLEGYDAYIALVCGEDTEKALYHELSHLMETVVLTRSTAYDRWENLNPQSFAYGRSPDQEWLQPGRKWFIDTYAMSSPQEDRARLFEYAMTAGHTELFRSPPLQQKLRQLCIGLREAFELEDHEGRLPWEQYLDG